MSSYAIKTDLKNVTGVDTSSFAKKTGLDIDKLENLAHNLINLKSKVNKLGVGKLVPVPVDLSKLSDVVKMMLLKRLNIMS